MDVRNRQTQSIPGILFFQFAQVNKQSIPGINLYTHYPANLPEEIKFTNNIYYLIRVDHWLAPPLSASPANFRMPGTMPNLIHFLINQNYTLLIVKKINTFLFYTAYGMGT